MTVQVPWWWIPASWMIVLILVLASITVGAIVAKIMSSRANTRAARELRKQQNKTKLRAVEKDGE